VGESGELGDASGRARRSDGSRWVAIDGDEFASILVSICTTTSLATSDVVVHRLGRT
jgi:hypothetical protein